MNKSNDDCGKKPNDFSLLAFNANHHTLRNYLLANGYSTMWYVLCLVCLSMHGHFIHIRHSKAPDDLN